MLTNRRDSSAGTLWQSRTKLARFWPILGEVSTELEGREGGKGDEWVGVTHPRAPESACVCACVYVCTHVRAVRSYVCACLCVRACVCLGAGALPPLAPTKGANSFGILLMCAIPSVSGSSFLRVEIDLAIPTIARSRTRKKGGPNWSGDEVTCSARLLMLHISAILCVISR